tara:strand:- start:3105 stop:4319 length:1215 start_codon:yes stop_codon:yes gene_type:complete
MYKVKSLNPPDFEPLPSDYMSGSLIFDNCNLLGIKVEISDDAEMCEFKLKEVIAMTFAQLGIDKNLPKTYGDQNDFMQLTRVNWNYIKNNPSKKLVITQKIQTVFTNFIKPLNRIIEKYELEDRVHFVSINPLDLKHQKYCKFKIHSLNPWTSVYLENLIRARRVGWEYGGDSFSLNHATHHFVSLCGRKKFFRNYATFLLKQKRLDEKGIYSYMAWKGETALQKKEMEDRKEELIKRGIPFDDFYNFVLNHTSHLDIEVFPTQIILTNRGASARLNKKGLINLVFESIANDNEIMITEKTMFCFKLGRPFLLIGNKGTLKYLREEFGFKTFDFLFDESYDNIADEVVKVQKVIEQLELFCSKPFEEQKELILKYNDVLEHNKKLATEFPHKKYYKEMLEKLYG